VASTTVDRFAAIRGDFKEGLLVTKPISWPGGDLVLNSTNSRYPRAHPTSGSGKLMVEVRDEGNQPIAGFSGDQKADHSFASPGPWQKKTVRFNGKRPITQRSGREENPPGILFAGFPAVFVSCQRTKG